MSNVRRIWRNTLNPKSRSPITRKESKTMAPKWKTTLVVFGAVLAFAIAGAHRASADVTFCGSVSGNWTNIATQTDSFQTLSLIQNDTSPAT